MPADLRSWPEAGPAPAVFAGIVLDRPRLMGIVNVTPDSFSDGGEARDVDAAIRRGHALVADGADLIDVGGESTRPGATPVTPEAELQRVLPVVCELTSAGITVSIDSRHASTMAACLDAGAAIVNDVTGLSGDPAAMGVVADRGAHAVLMHMQGDPQTMQISPYYEDVTREVHARLAARVAACEAAGIPRQRVAVDPGIGFGKTTEHNLAILTGLDVYRDLGCVLVVGVSRKGFIARLSRKEPPRQRVAGSVAAGLWAVARGAHILRVHDVSEMRQALAVWQALEGAAGGDPAGRDRADHP